MKLLFGLVTLALLSACNGSSSGGSASTEPVSRIVTPVAAKCAGVRAVGQWSRGSSSDKDLVFNDDCTFRINHCGTTYEIVTDMANPAMSSWQSIRFRVASFDFIQDGCLRPGVGDFTCNIVVARDNGLHKDALSISCADDNFYRTQVTFSFYQPF